jgi:hypothetical protein
MKRSTTPTFLLELPLCADAGQAVRLRAHLEVARCFYNALLGEARKRLQQMRADPAWQAARSLARDQKQAAFAHLRQQYGYTEYGLHAYAKAARQSWLADHLDSTMAQTLATRAYQAVNRVCLGKARMVRFKSRGRGLDSVEGKRNDTGMRFLLQKPEAGNGSGWLLWGEDRIPALIDWTDPLVRHALSQPIKYVRLIRRKASSSHAKGADSEGKRFFVQLVLRGTPYQKLKNQAGSDTIGLDIGPSGPGDLLSSRDCAAQDVLRGVANGWQEETAPGAQDGATAPGHQSRKLRRARSGEKARQAPTQLEAQPGLPGHSSPTCQG